VIPDATEGLDGPVYPANTEMSGSDMSGCQRNALYEPESVAMPPLWVVPVASFGLVIGMVSAADAQEMKFADCPAAVKKALQAEAKGAKIETVHKESEEDEETVFWADVAIGGRTYAIGVLEDGTLTEMNLAIEDKELPFERCPAPVQATFHREAFGEKVGAVGKDMKYGVMIYETLVHHNGKPYEIVVAEDGTLVEKVLVIDDEEVELAKCPTAVQATLHAHAKGGKIGVITRSTGIVRHTYEAEIEINAKVYSIEVGESGLLISKSLEAGEE
jgi:hypothetical protein